MVYCNGLENRRTAGYREFESHPFRQIILGKFQMYKFSKFFIHDLFVILLLCCSYTYFKGQEYYLVFASLFALSIPTIFRIKKYSYRKYKYCTILFTSFFLILALLVDYIFPNMDGEELLAIGFISLVISVLIPLYYILCWYCFINSKE